MNGRLAIRVENLGKRYRLGRRESYQTLRDSIVRLFSLPFRSLTSISPRSDEIWALQDVSFEIKRGEVVGIIGRNGAGKSTLLKILSRITEPIEGWAEIHGRIGSLLEVGTGFHGELTGRENVYLNGAILGMKKAEINRKFDEMVAFAEVDKFLDTPVKHYSSGMFLRLAFAVAAHLEPDILLVDEVLAVGDARFQQKSFGKMEELSRGGRTVLVVSHNLAGLKSLCQRAILLNQGRVGYDGNIEDAIQTYLFDPLAQTGEMYFEPNSRRMQILRVTLRDAQGHPTNQLDMCQPFGIEIEYGVQTPIQGAHVACYISDQFGQSILATTDGDLNHQALGQRDPGRYIARLRIPAGLINSGSYRLAVATGIHNVELFDWKDGMSFTLVPTSPVSAIRVNPSIHPILQITVPWSTQPLGPAS
jgi:lipopolysaccharide transport system ATP-binding protein